jgi:prolyl-tRNA editing enzyme YbaK/EbsC (Cys-tRNA(Pro) deacylase)
MNPDLSDSARRVQDFLSQKGSEAVVRLLPESTATALEAATALGVPVSHIGKSIVFDSEKGVVVAVVCGDQRVDTACLAAILEVVNLRPLRAEGVKKETGFVIGGVSPFGLPPNVRIIVDARLKTLGRCYVAAGHPKAVVGVDFNSLVALTGAQVEPIAIAH